MPDWKPADPFFSPPPQKTRGGASLFRPEPGWAAHGASARLPTTGGTLDCPRLPPGRKVSLVAAACLLVLVAACPAEAAEEPSDAAKQAWKTTERNGVSWLVDPQGRLFYSKGVNSVEGGLPSERSRRGLAYFWGNFYPCLDAWQQSAGTRLLQWGFNTLGGWSDPSPRLPLALTVNLEIGRNAQLPWFDPFDPTMERRVLLWAEMLTARFRRESRLIGYFTDNELGWWNSPLFEWFLKMGWHNHTKRVLWQLLYDQYQGQWDLFLRDWVPASWIRGFEDLKKPGAQLKLRPGGRGIRVVDRFLYMCARRYYELTSRAIRRAHPEALVLGDRLPLYYHQDAVLAMRDFVDVVSTNYNVDVPDGWVAPYYFEGLARLSDKPVLVTEWFFAAEENRSGNRNETAGSEYPDPGHLMTVKSQLERAAGAAAALAGFAAFPNVVGTHWFQYTDEPQGGRADGEDYNMGLVDNSDRPYEELVQTFSRLNPQLEAMHARARWEFTGGPTEGNGTSDPGPDSAKELAPARIRRARKPIDVSDQSLVDWEKRETRLKGLRAPPPHVPFGDLHACWSPKGLYLASIANTYVNAGFLATASEFPLSECFQVHLYLDLQDGAGVRHFAVYLQPVRNPRSRDGFDVAVALCRLAEGAAPKRLPTAGRVQRIEKTLPHMVFEAFLPCEWFGLDEIRPGTTARMNVLAVSFHREFVMNWCGDPVGPDEALDRVGACLRPVVFEGDLAGSE